MRLFQLKKTIVKIPFFFFILILLEILSIQKVFYYFFFPIFGNGVSYVINQNLLCILGLVISGFFIKKENLLEKFKNFFRMNLPSLSILLAATAFAHDYLLRYFFYADDVPFILQPTKNNVFEKLYHYTIIGHPFSPYVLANLLFGIHAQAYNITTLLFLFFSVSIVYILSFLLTKNAVASIFAGLFLATTPAFLDMFSWQAAAMGTTFVFLVSSLSILFLIYYLQTKKMLSLYIALIFLSGSFDIGFVRVAGMFFVFCFLYLFYSFQSIKNSIQRLLILFPLFFTWYMHLEATQGKANTLTGSHTFSLASYLNILFYFFAQLTLPATKAKHIFNLVHHMNDKITSGFISIPSVTALIGFIVIFLITMITIYIFLSKKSNKKFFLFGLVFLFANIFYVPILGGIQYSLIQFDTFFLSDYPPLGPGSRYLFFPAVGLALFFAYLITIFKKLPGKIFIFLFLIFVYINTEATYTNHQKTVQQFFDNESAAVNFFFYMVPRDGKKKLVFSVNPHSNAIDTEFGGWQWLYGFYTNKELTYTNSFDTFTSLMKTGTYKENNVYGYYSNFATKATANTTQALHDEFFAGKNKEIPISFVQKNSPDFRTIFFADKPTIRLIKPRILQANITIQKSDSINASSNIIFTNNFQTTPHASWGLIPKNKPLLLKNQENYKSIVDAMLNKNFLFSNFSAQQRLQMLTLLKNRDLFKSETLITVSDKDTNDPRVTEESLIDGQYTTPDPSINDTFYQSNHIPTPDKPVILTFHFPHPITLGRLVTNTPSSLAPDHTPQAMDIFAGLSGSVWQKVATMDNEISTTWSPNGGHTRDITLNHVIADSLELIITKTTGNLPVSFDEITIDDEQTREFSPEQLYDYGQMAFLHIDNQDEYTAAVNLASSNTITLLYACAENTDWQQQQRMKDELIPQIWKENTFTFNPTAQQINYSSPINCDGSVLRQLILLGPPYTAFIDLKNVTLHMP